MNIYIKSRSQVNENKIIQEIYKYKYVYSYEPHIIGIERCDLEKNWDMKEKVLFPDSDSPRNF